MLPSGRSSAITREQCPGLHGPWCLVPLSRSLWPESSSWPAQPWVPLSRSRARMLYNLQAPGEVSATVSTPTRRLKQREVDVPRIHVTSERQLDSGLRRAPRRWLLPSTASLTAPQGSSLRFPEHPRWQSGGRPLLRGPRTQPTLPVQTPPILAPPRR